MCSPRPVERTREQRLGLRDDGLERLLRGGGGADGGEEPGRVELQPVGPFTTKREEPAYAGTFTMADRYEPGGPPDSPCDVRSPA